MRRGYSCNKQPNFRRNVRPNRDVPPPHTVVLQARLESPIRERRRQMARVLKPGARFPDGSTRKLCKETNYSRLPLQRLLEQDDALAASVRRYACRRRIRCGPSMRLDSVGLSSLTNSLISTNVPLSNYRAWQGQGKLHGVRRRVQHRGRDRGAAEGDRRGRRLETR